MSLVFGFSVAVNFVRVNKFRDFKFLTFENGKNVLDDKRKAKADESAGIADKSKPRSRKYGKVTCLGFTRIFITREEMLYCVLSEKVMH